MGDLWSDLKLVLMLVFFLYLLSWSNEFTGSKKLGLLIAVIIAYLTFFQHFEILIWILILFFAYPFFTAVSEGLSGK